MPRCSVSAWPYPAEGGSDGVRRPFGLAGRDVEMGAGSDHVSAGAVYQDSTFSKRVTYFLTCRQFGIYFEPDDIGFNFGWVEPQAGRVSDGLCNRPSVAMILGETINVVVERVKSGCGDYARLPHSAAQKFANPLRLDNEVTLTGQGGADRRAQSLAEANRDAIKMTRPLF